MEEENFAIEVKSLSKRYTIGSKTDGSLRGSLAKAFQSAQKGEDFWALKDVSFKINRGDVVGIIGRNGAGKSTILKVLSQITQPTEGRIEINGRVASLLEVGTGFHPELSGRENIFLNGTILGMTRKEVKSKFDEIVEFSGVEKFIDTAVKHYSSGMYVRLAFAVAAHLEPEVLIIDEVLAVGDASFQKKCLGKMGDIAKEGRTVIFVSHDMGAVSSLCNRGILLQSGKITHDGTVEEVVEKYLNNPDDRTDSSERYQNNEYSDWDEKVILHHVKLVDENENEITNFGIDTKIGVQVDFEVLTDDLIHPIPNIHISHSLGGKICVSVNQCEFSKFSSKGRHSTTAWIPSNFFNCGYFNIGIAISTLDPSQVHVADYDALSFEVLDDLDSKSRNGYAGKMDGYMRPIFNWDNKTLNK